MSCIYSGAPHQFCLLVCKPMNTLAVSPINQQYITVNQLTITSLTIVDQVSRIPQGYSKSIPHKAS